MNLTNSVHDVRAFGPLLIKLQNFQSLLQCQHCSALVFPAKCGVKLAKEWQKMILHSVMIGLQSNFHF